MASPKKHPRSFPARTDGSSNGAIGGGGKTRQARRPYRILAFALLFVLTSLRRMHWNENAHFEFLTSLLDIDPTKVKAGPANRTALLNGRMDASRYDAARGADLIIFYNLYVPHDKEGIRNAKEVIDDQMGQIANVLKRMEGEDSKEEKRGALLYNLIGNENAFSTRDMSSLCHKLHPRLECKLIQYYPEAGESVTLQDVHDFCMSNVAMQNTANNNLNGATNNGNRTDTRVAYLHSKGSYHSQPENHIWRKQMTDAALHPQCLNPPDEACDVCGAQFYIKYAIMFPGNMWTAKCSYVRKLIPPNLGEYERRKAESVKRFLMLRLWGVLAATLDTDNVEHFGLDRYQWEHWIAHPSIKPCEVHTTDVGPLILLGKDPEGRKFGPKYYDWGMAPRRIKHNLGGLRAPRLRLERSVDRQMREYYYLPGNLLKWFHLYGKEGVPDEDSWVWRHFPAGDRWKEMVDKHGERALDAFVEGAKPRFHSAFASKDAVSSDTASFDAGDLSASNPPLVVFYQITMPPPEDRNAALSVISAQIDALAMGPYDNVTKSFDVNRKVLLYYAISGGISQDKDHVSKLCDDKSDRITCKRLGRYTEGITGEGLRSLHSFCIANPSQDVVYISNRLPRHKRTDRSFNATSISAMTTAVTSKLCSTSTSDSCNVCGTEFYPLPFLHFSGNMFSASCGYVKDLLPPPTFEEKMNEIAADAQIKQIEEVFTTKLTRFDEEVLGSYQHSVEHWIGSHPNLRPCDVAPIFGLGSIGGKMINQLKHYSRHPAPRRGSAPPGSLGDHEGELAFRKRREVALREYYYLAGNVFRWHRLYEKVPDVDSWVWHWFPDGGIWQAAARTGPDAVNEMADRLLGAGDDSAVRIIDEET